MELALPDAQGYWGPFGGQFVPETLMSALDELISAYEKYQSDPEYKYDLDHLLKNFVGRSTPLYYARRLSRISGKARIYLKREDLAHTGAHKINNTVGQVLLAHRMGKKRIIAETGAGQHGVATATVCALLDLDCVVYMGADDIKRQRMNVFRMELLGAEVISVETGSRTLKDAINEAIRDWVTNIHNTFYCIGSVVGPHPYPMMVRDFQSVIGEETRRQILEIEGRLPDVITASVGGGSNAMGMFYPFLKDSVQLVGVEAGGSALQPGQHCASLGAGSIGVLHGAKSYLLQDQHGQILPTHSISAGLDYPGVGPEHAHLKDTGRVDYVSVNDEEALAAFRLLSQTEGILPALESAHALAQAMKCAEDCKSGTLIVVNLSGRGDKDLEIVEGLV